MEQEGYLLEEEKEFKRFYKLSLWWVEHRAQVQRLGLIALGVVEGLILLFVAWTYVDAYLISYDRERTQVAQLATGVLDLNAFTTATAGKDLTTTAPSVLSAGEGTFDFYATVVNPNADWWAEFEYAFTSGAFTTPVAEGFVLPGETKPMLALSVPSVSVPQGAALTLTNVIWHRVDKRITGPYESFEAEHLALPITELLFVPDLVVDGGRPVGRVSFRVTNATAYAYYEPAFIILLKRGNTVVGANRTTISSLDPGEFRDVEVNWFGAVPSASAVEVIPEINIFDPGVYKPL